MSIVRNPGRSAGLIYLLIVFLAPLRLIYIPGKLFVHGDAAATADNIAAHQLLFRFGIVADLATGVILIFLTLALYRLFKDYGKTSAVLMVILGGLLPAALYFVNALNDAAVLVTLHGADILTAFSQAQREGLMSLFLRLHTHGVYIAEIFWGLWLLPLAQLTWRSRLVPRFLAVWLVINGIAYVAQSLTSLLLPRYEDALSRALSPVLLGEIVFMLWLVVRGTRSPLPSVEAR
jgi:hypothetical protein